MYPQGNMSDLVERVPAVGAGDPTQDRSEPLANQGARMIDVLIAEDSPTSREFLRQLLEADPGIRVIGTAVNGHEAIAAVQRQAPHLLLMDVHMPHLDGFEATRQLMRTRPLPIVIVSGTVDDQVAATFRAIDAGALAFVQQPPGPLHPQHAAAVATLLNTVKLMAEVKVVRRWTEPATRAAAGSAPTVAPSPPPSIAVIGIGASTGGPAALRELLGELGPALRVPVLVVQHIAAGFLPGFAEWLTSSCGLPVSVATHGEIARPGHVYLAQEDCHLGLDRHGRIQLDGAPAEHGLRPAVSFLFRSLRNACGERAVGVLLSGMGRDGADELKSLRDAGALTIAQDAASSVVFGMPGEAVRLGAARHVLAPEQIAALLKRLLSDMDS